MDLDTVTEYRSARSRDDLLLAPSERFVAGGTWRTAVTLRHASADPARIRLALAQKLRTLGAEPKPSTPEAFGQFIRSESAKWAKVVAEAGIKSE